MQQPHKMNKEG